MRANGLIEGSTIVAIIVGTVVGARIADSSRCARARRDHRVLCSLGRRNLLAAAVLAARAAPQRAGVATFTAMMRKLFTTARARFAMLGNSLFWASAAVLRLLLVAWAPVVLATQTAADVADLTLFLALGIVIGSLVVPQLIPIEKLRRARLAAYAMGACIVAFSLVDTIWPARAVLVAIGLCGGMFMVPMNAALQEIGHKSIGSGGAVALQSFFENLAMLVAVGAYTGSVSLGAAPVPSIVAVGTLVLVATFLVSWHLPPDPAARGDA